MTVTNRIIQAIYDLQSQRMGGLPQGAVIHVGRREWCELMSERDAPKHMSFDQSSGHRFMGIVVRLEPVETLLEIKP